MKRILKIATATVILLILIPSLLMNGQEKKTKQKIKVVVADKDGEKIIIDTTFNDLISSDSIKLKDGTVVFIGDGKILSSSLTGKGNISKDIMVTMNREDSSENKVVKTITIRNSDSIRVIKDDGDKIIVMKGGKYIARGNGDNVMAWVSEDKDSGGNKYVYVNKRLSDDKKGEKTLDIQVTSDESGEVNEETNYVIARDGITVSIEGNNEQKVKELADLIEAAMDKKNGDSAKQVITEKEKKKSNKNK
jgi:hypothetical protein